MSNGSDLSFQDFLRLPLNDSDLIRVVRMFNGKKHELVIYWKDVKTLLGQGVLLKVNGVNNPVQNILNLVDGTNITIVDNNDGSVTINATGGGGTYTVDNGLNENPAGTFKLGGTLGENTEINTVDFEFLFKGTSSSQNQLLKLEQLGSSKYALYIESLLGWGINVLARANGLQVESRFANTFLAILRNQGSAINNAPIESRIVTASSLGTQLNILRLRRNTEGELPLNGYGSYIGFDLFTNGGSIALTAEAARIGVGWEDATASSSRAFYNIMLRVNNTTFSELLRLSGTGQLRLHNYTTSTSFASVSGASVGVLNVDNQGQVFVGAGGGGGGEVNTASNVGGEKEVFKQKTGTDLEFRTLKEGDNVTITQNTDDLEIDVELIDIYDEDGIVKSNVKDINVFYPLIATDAGANTAALQVDPASALASVMVEKARFNMPSFDTRTILYVASVNKLYVRTNNASIRIFNASTYELLATVAGGSVVGLGYISAIDEVWAQGTTTTTVRINPTTNAVIGSIAGTTSTKSTFIEVGAKVYSFFQGNAAGFVSVNSGTLAVTTLNWGTNKTIRWGALCTKVGSAMEGYIVATSAGAATGLQIWDTLTDTSVIEDVTTGFTTPAGVRIIEYSPLLDTFIVANVDDNTVVYLTVATSTTFTVTRTIRTMLSPNAIIIDEVNGLLLVNHSTLPFGRIFVSKFRLSDGEPLGIIETGTTSNSVNLGGYMAKKGSEPIVYSGYGHTSVAVPVSEVKYL